MYLSEVILIFAKQTFAEQTFAKLTFAEQTFAEQTFAANDNTLPCENIDNKFSPRSEFDCNK